MGRGQVGDEDSRSIRPRPLSRIRPPRQIGFAPPTVGWVWHLGGRGRPPPPVSVQGEAGRKNSTPPGGELRGWVGEKIRPEKRDLPCETIAGEFQLPATMAKVMKGAGLYARA